MKARKGISSYIAKLALDSEEIHPERKAILAEFAQAVKELRQSFGTAPVIFICTHNSRRSQLAESWYRVLARHFGIPQTDAFSAGTEATAFHPNMVNAMEQAGFGLFSNGDDSNPEYVLKGTDGEDFQRPLFSKTLSDPTLPSDGFLAITVCSDADEKCPVVYGAFRKLHLPYRDPKYADNSPGTSAAYLRTVEEIGRDLVFVVRLLK